MTTHSETPALHEIGDVDDLTMCVWWGPAATSSGAGGLRSASESDCGGGHRSPAPTSPPSPGSQRSSMEFVILPDRPDTGTLIDRLELPVVVSVLPHPSGRPWLIGDWTSPELVTVRWGDRAVAIGLSDAETSR